MHNSETNYAQIFEIVSIKKNAFLTIGTAPNILES